MSTKLVETNYKHDNWLLALGYGSKNVYTHLKPSKLQVIYIGLSLDEAQSWG